MYTVQGFVAICYIILSNQMWIQSWSRIRSNEAVYTVLYKNEKNDVKKDKSKNKDGGSDNDMTHKTNNTNVAFQFNKFITS